MPKEERAALEAFKKEPRYIIDPATGKRLPQPVYGELSVGQETGRVGLQKVERNLVNPRGSEARATEFFLNQKNKLVQWGRRLMAKAGPQVSPDPFDVVAAGEKVEGRLTQRIRDAKGYADRAYDSIRKQLSRKPQQVVIDYARDAYGNPKYVFDQATGKWVPQAIYGTFEAPVELGSLRRRLQPIYDELTRSMPEARRANSPAYRALADLMESKDTHMNAMDFDRSMGAIKVLAREGDNPYLSTQSQRVAKIIIGEGEKQFRQAVGKVSPKIEQQLERGRAAVKGYHETAELLNELGQEPAGIYKFLTAAGDQHYRTLLDVYQFAPQAMRVVGRMYLEGMIETATREGGFTGAEGMLNQWLTKGLGTRTKTLIFGRELSADLDNFVRAAKKVAPHEGSNTAGKLMAMHALGGGADIGVGVLVYILSGNLTKAGAATTAAEFSRWAVRTQVKPRIMARLLLTPGGAKLLTEAITLPPASPAFKNTMRVLGARAALAGQQVREEEERTSRPEPSADRAAVPAR
jgi:hypothetical protein